MVEDVYNYIQDNPGSNSADIRAGIPMTHDGLTYCINKLVLAGRINRNAEGAWQPYAEVTLLN